MKNNNNKSITFVIAFCQTLANYYSPNRGRLSYLTSLVTVMYNNHPLRKVFRKTFAALWMFCRQNWSWDPLVK